jgi:hypothetical protein
MKLIGAVGLAAALFTAGCGSDSTTAPATSVPTSPTTEKFTSIVSPLGGVSREFTALKAGAVTVTLTKADPPSTVVVGLGIGIPVSPGGCSLTNIVNTAAGSTPQLTMNVDPGAYCVAVVDVGNAPPTGVTFFVDIFHP